MFIYRIQRISKASTLICSLFLLVSFTHAQNDNATRPRTDQDAPAVWQFKEYDEISRSAVRIKVTLNKNGVLTHAHGSGVIISRLSEKHPTIEGLTRGIIATCAHVTPELFTLGLKVEYQNGTSSKAQILATNSETDVSLIQAWIPDEYKLIPPSKKEVKSGDTVRVCGYGVIYDCKKPRYFECKVFRSCPMIIVLREDAVPGDSGGPIFDEDGNLVGLISQGVTHFQKVDGVPYTGPASGPSVTAIKHLIAIYLTEATSGIND